MRPSSYPQTIPLNVSEGQTREHSFVVLSIVTTVLPDSVSRTLSTPLVTFPMATLCPSGLNEVIHSEGGSNGCSWNLWYDNFPVRFSSIAGRIGYWLVEIDGNLIVEQRHIWEALAHHSPEVLRHVTFCRKTRVSSPSKNLARSIRPRSVRVAAFNSHRTGPNQPFCVILVLKFIAFQRIFVCKFTAFFICIVTRDVSSILASPVPQNTKCIVSLWKLNRSAWSKL